VKTRQRGVMTAGARLQGPIGSDGKGGRWHCWGAALLPSSSRSSRHPLSQHGRCSAVQWDDTAWTASLNCSQGKGKKERKMDIPVLVFC